MKEKLSNQLINENSPYLIQHAYNPVDWHPWGFVSLDKARRENKLLVISIGYAACHWCHVMEHESFEDQDVADAMNERFVSVKVDREERPDIDQIYMAAAYATTGRGGWPLNVIALPDQRPVFAGTYFRKSDWLYILKYYADLFKAHPEELNYQAVQIATGMRKQFQLPVAVYSETISEVKAVDLFKSMQRDIDSVNGGTIGAPKFPMPVTLQFLMAYGKLNESALALDHVELTLNRMRMGGIYDHLGGGFSRYSVDEEWHVPHFEKMLYDNAQLISLYSNGYRQWKRYNWKEVVEETIAFAEAELTSAEGLFYASIDADSEGREGAFYVWTEEEIRRYLDQTADVFLDYYSCTPHGNWEHGWNVLKASGAGIEDDNLYALMQVCRRQLKTVRDNRPRPATDDKILTCWNALMISALVDASLAFGRDAWLERAVNVAEFYRIHLGERDGKLWRNSKGGSYTIPGFLDDYSLLTKAFLDLYQATFEDRWLEAAHQLTNQVLSCFSAPDQLFFNLASTEESVVVMKSAELSDNVIPASNSVMAHNLFVIGHILGHMNLVERSERMVKAMMHDVRKNPSFHANWATLLAFMQSGSAEVQIVGERAVAVRKSFAGLFLPGVIWSGGEIGLAAGLRERSVSGKTLIYVCKNKSCHPPAESLEEAIKNLNFGSLNQ